MQAATDIRISRLTSPETVRAAARLMSSSDPWLRLGINYAGCLKSLKTPYRELYGTLRSGELKGLVLVTMYGTLKGYIQALCVSPELRGEGVGEALLLYAEKRIFKESPNVFLCVSSFNTGAIRFYRRLGYKKTGLLKDFIINGSDEILMRKTRGPLRGAAQRRNKRKP